MFYLYMKSTYITIILFSIILLIIFAIYFVKIPSPGKVVKEPIKLEIK